MNKRLLKYVFFFCFGVFLIQPTDDSRPVVLSPDADMKRTDETRLIVPLVPIKPLSRPVDESSLRQQGVITAEAGRLIVEQALAQALPDDVAAAQSRYVPVDRGRILRATPKEAMKNDVPRALVAHRRVTLILTKEGSGEVLGFYRLQNGDAYLPPDEDGYGIVTDRLSALTLYEYGEESVLFQNNTNDAGALFFAKISKG